MTIYNAIKTIINDHDYDLEKDDVKKLIAMAYYIGREEATKDISDSYRKLLAEQKARAATCRYHKMALAIQGNVDFVYSGDYAGDMIKTFGHDKSDVAAALVK